MSQIIGFRCQVSGVSPATGCCSGQLDRKRNFNLSEFIKKRISNVEEIYSIYFIKRLSKPTPRIGYEGGEQIHSSKFDSTESFDPEFFNYELTTEGLVAGCGSLVLKSIRRSVINIQRSMLTVRLWRLHCFGQTEFHTRLQYLASPFPDTRNLTPETFFLPSCLRG